MSPPRKSTDSDPIVLLTQWFTPEPALVVREVLEAIKRGPFPVEVVTGIPNYPDGRAYAGYSWWRSYHEDVGGVNVLRVPLWPSHSNSSIGRIVNYASFAASSSLLALSRFRRSAGVVVYGSPITAGLGALLARRMFGIRYVVLVEDLWPDALVESGMVPGGPLGRIARATSKYFSESVYRHASALLPISEGMAAVLEERGFRSDRLTVVMNWAPDEFEGPLQPTGRLRSRLALGSDSLLLVYSGNLGRTHGLDGWLRAVAALEPHLDVSLVVIGAGVAKDQLVALSRRLDSKNIHFMEYVDRDTYVSYLSDADAVIVALRRGEGLSTSLPSKIPAALAAGKIILACAEGDAACAVERAAGIVAADDTPEGIKQAVLRLASLPGPERTRRSQQAYDYYSSTMSAHLGSEVMVQCISQALMFNAVSQVGPEVE